LCSSSTRGTSPSTAASHRLQHGDRREPRRQPDDVTGDGGVDERDRELAPPTSLARRAHKRGLEVHTWTFRNEPRRLASDFGGDPLAEYALFFALGVDGVFSGFTDTAVAAREAFLAG